MPRKFTRRLSEQLPLLPGKVTDFEREGGGPPAAHLSRGGGRARVDGGGVGRERSPNRCSSDVYSFSSFRFLPKCSTYSFLLLGLQMKAALVLLLGVVALTEGKVDPLLLLVSLG